MKSFALHLSNSTLAKGNWIPSYKTIESAMRQGVALRKLGKYTRWTVWRQNPFQVVAESVYPPARITHCYTF